MQLRLEVRVRKLSQLLRFPISHSFANRQQEDAEAVPERPLTASDEVFSGGW